MRLGWWKYDGIIGFDDPDLSSLEGLSDDVLDSLEELAGLNLTEDQLKELKTLAGEDPPNDEKLRSVLQKERKARRESDKRVKSVQRELEELKAKGEGGGKKEDPEKESKTSTSPADERRSEKLAQKLLASSTESAIVRVMGSPKLVEKLGIRFKDPDDVLKLVDRALIEADQDDDDPTEITIDDDSIVTALRSLARKKPHLLLPKEGEMSSEGRSRSGSQFGGSRDGATDKATRQQELKKKYPALGRR